MLIYLFDANTNMIFCKWLNLLNFLQGDIPANKVFQAYYVKSQLKPGFYKLTVFNTLHTIRLFSNT